MRKHSSVASVLRTHGITDQAARACVIAVSPERGTRGENSEHSNYHDRASIGPGA